MIQFKKENVNYSLPKGVNIYQPERDGLVSLVELTGGNYTSNTTYNTQSTSINSIFLINDVVDFKQVNSSSGTDSTGVLEQKFVYDTTEIDTHFPLFFHNPNIIKIPSKVKYVLERHTPKKLLNEIDKDNKVAIEMCILFLGMLTYTYFSVKDGSNPLGWKALKTEYLRSLFSKSPQAYEKIREALEFPLEKGEIIECDYTYCPQKKSFEYRLGNNYIGKGIVSYELNTKLAQDAIKKYYYRAMYRSAQNPICKNLFKLYSNINLPTTVQLIIEGKKLAQAKQLTKKGKIITMRYKKKNDYWLDADKRSFVEDDIELFEYLTDNGLRIPYAGSEKSGGRVIDSFTLMPSWIRKLVTVEGQPLIECDYSALHPNIAIKHYGGNMHNITHKVVAENLNIELSKVKTQHLSFFNATVIQMKGSPLYKYYTKYEPKMIENIIREKNSSEFGYYITSRRMFKKEVDIMTEVITKLNFLGIYVMYVYDALLCIPENVETVVSLMNETALKFDVHTTAKFDSCYKVKR